MTVSKKKKKNYFPYWLVVAVAFWIGRAFRFILFFCIFCICSLTHGVPLAVFVKVSNGIGSCSAKERPFFFFFVCFFFFLIYLYCNRIKK